MRRAYDAEVPPVESRDLRRTEPLGDGDDGGVDSAEAEVGVMLDEVGRAAQVFVADMLDDEAAGDEATKEPGLDGGACSAGE